MLCKFWKDCSKGFQILVVENGWGRARGCKVEGFDEAQLQRIRGDGKRWKCPLIGASFMNGLIESGSTRPTCSSSQLWGRQRWDDAMLCWPTTPCEPCAMDLKNLRGLHGWLDGLVLCLRSFDMSFGMFGLLIIGPFSLWLGPQRGPPKKKTIPNEKPPKPSKVDVPMLYSSRDP